MRFNANTALAATCLILAAALPISVAAHLLASPAHLVAKQIGLPLSSTLSLPGSQFSALQWTIVLLAGLAPVSFMSVALRGASRCFRHFARREYFTLAVVRGLQGCAKALFIASALGLLVVPLASIALSAANHDEHLSLAFNISSSQVLLLLFAAIVWQISAVMAEAVAVAEENSQFV